MTDIQRWKLRGAGCILVGWVMCALGGYSLLGLAGLYLSIGIPLFAYGISITSISIDMEVNHQMKT